MPRRSNKVEAFLMDRNASVGPVTFGPPQVASRKKKISTSERASLPPARALHHLDSIDNIVSKIDQTQDDKYRTPALQNSTSIILSDVSESDSQQGDSSYFTNNTSLTTDVESRGTNATAATDGLMSMSSEMLEKRPRDINDLYQILEESDYYHTKQKFAYCAITISALQLLCLALQLSLCGVAPLDVNPMVGTYPDAISQWGGKNPYLMKSQNEWWRLITPAFLHVGVLHLLVNAAVQLETCAFFEREWGSTRYLWIYLISEVGYCITASSATPDTLGVGSSGALMGLFGAKLAQVMTQVCFDMSNQEDDSIRLEQLSSVLCSLSVILALSFFTYIDWSGHMGALGAGFLVGVISFSKPIRNRLSRALWRLSGVILLLTILPLAFYYFILFVEPDEELGDTCEYYRNLYAEGYDCQCFLF